MLLVQHHYTDYGVCDISFFVTMKVTIITAKIFRNHSAATTTTLCLYLEFVRLVEHLYYFVQTVEKESTKKIEIVSVLWLIARRLSSFPFLRYI